MSPEQLRAFNGALAQLRHLYMNLVHGHVKGEEGCKTIARYLLSPQIARLEALYQQLTVEEA